MRWRAGLATALWFAFVLSANAQDLPSSAELRERLRTFERMELDPSVRRPLELADSALERAEQRLLRGDETGERRAREIASAALELTASRLELLRERALLYAARGRRVEAERNVRTAEQALQRERTRAKELEQVTKRP